MGFAFPFLSLAPFFLLASPSNLRDFACAVPFVWNILFPQLLAVFSPSHFLRSLLEYRLGGASPSQPCPTPTPCTSFTPYPALFFLRSSGHCLHTVYSFVFLLPQEGGVFFTAASPASGTGHAQHLISAQ